MVTAFRARERASYSWVGTSSPATARILRAICALTLTLAAWPTSTLAQIDGAPVSLKGIFEAAWRRQPEAQSLAVQRESAAARRGIAASWIAESPTLQLSGKSDELTRNQGAREYEVGIALPLWLAGERAATNSLAAAERRAVDSRALGAQLRLASEVRNAWWVWQRARADHELATVRMGNARQLAADVTRRVAAGDLARADQHQAEGAAAGAESAHAEASGALSTAARHLSALTGAHLSPPPMLNGGINGEPVPVIPPSFTETDLNHAGIAELLDRAEVARRAADLARVQKRANPELSIAATTERTAFGDSFQQMLTLGLRLPLGSDARSRHKAAAAQAEAIEEG